MSSLHLRPLSKSDVRVGAPLPWPVYNDKRQLLLRAGFVIETSGQLEKLIMGGLFRPREHHGHDPFVTEPKPKAPNAPGPAATGGHHKAHDKHHEVQHLNFAETGLAPGASIQVSLEHGSADRHYLRLIGFLEKKSIIVSHPEADGHLLFVKDGTSYHCKAFHGKRVFDFHANAVRTYMQPFPYLHLSYPDKVSSMAVRGSHRIKTTIIAALTLDGAHTGIPCTIRDLGLNGVQIHLPMMDCQPEARVHVAFRLTIDDEKLLFEIPAVVKRTHKFISDAGFESLELGVQFLEMSPERRRLLEIHIYRHLLAISDHHN